jgi:RNA exonuclease 4
VQATIDRNEHQSDVEHEWLDGLLSKYRDHDELYEGSDTEDGGLVAHPPPAVSSEHSTNGQGQERRRKALNTKSTRSDPAKAGRYVGLDCEMVGVGEENKHALARVSIVNYHGHVLLDTFVRPKELVTDFRTWVSGVRKHHFRDAITFSECQKLVHALIKDKIVVGHALKNDFAVLLLSHPRRMIRDTSSYKPFRINGRIASLKSLAKTYLDREIQSGEHSSVDDARAAMDLYKLVRDDWEQELVKHRSKKTK